MEEKDRKQSLRIAAVVAIIVSGVIAYSVFHAGKPASPAENGAPGVSGMASEGLEDLKTATGTAAAGGKGEIYDGKGGFLEPEGSSSGSVIGASDLSPQELRRQVALRLASLKAQLESLLQKYRNQEIAAQDVSRRLAEIKTELLALQQIDFNSSAVRESASAALERAATDLHAMGIAEAANAAERARTMSVLLEIRVKLYQLSNLMAEWKRVSPATFAYPLPTSP